jgi:hypothetical protein
MIEMTMSKDNSPNSTKIEITGDQVSDQPIAGVDENGTILVFYPDMLGNPRP